MLSKLSPGLYNLILRTSYKGVNSTFSYYIFIDKNLRAGFPKNTQDTSGNFGAYISALGLEGQPTIYDIDNDGIKEIIIAYGEGVNNTKVHAYKPDGTEARNFPVILPGISLQRGPIVFDSDRDGYGEIFVDGNHLEDDGYISGGMYKIRYDGSFSYQEGPSIDPLIAEDLNNDGLKEIYSASDFVADEFYLFNSNLEPFDNWPVDLRGYLSQPYDIEDGTEYDIVAAYQQVLILIIIK